MAALTAFVIEDSPTMRHWFDPARRDERANRRSLLELVVALTPMRISAQPWPMAGRTHQTVRVGLPR